MNANDTSPCDGTCELDATETFCRGCLRTLLEIQDWAAYDEKTRIDVLASIAARRAALGQKPGGTS